MEKKYQIIKLDQKEKWNIIVKEFRNYDVFYLAEYVEAFKEHGDGEPILFYYNDGETKAINVIMKRDIADLASFNKKIEKNMFFDVTSPYGYGGFIIEGDNYQEVNKEYERYCKDSNIICEFVRFHLLEHYEKKYDGVSVNLKHNIIRKIDMKPEEMLMDFEHKVRKNIKKANRNGLQIQIDTEGKTLKEFMKIYYNTMDRNNATEEYYFHEEFFKTINKMKDNIAYFNVIYDEKTISTELVIYSKNNCYSYLGGTLSEYFELRPNDFLKYEIVKWAYAKGIKNFILGGGYGNEDDGIYRYKKSFAPNGICDFYIGEKIFDKEKYEELVQLKKEEENFDANTNFFPKYRA